jgi:hypothetical protein
MVIIEEYKQAINNLFHPGSINKSMGIVDALMYYWKATLIPFAITLVEIIAIGGIFAYLLSIAQLAIPYIGILLSVGLPIFAIIWWLIIVPLSLLIDSFVLHVFGKYLFKWFKGEYADTFAGSVYAIASGLSFIWIPVIGLLIAIFGSFIIELIAIANLNKTTAVKVLLAVIIGGIILDLVFFVIAHL